jgi:hypothetical protein
MTILATIFSAILLLVLIWQILGSVWNIVAIVVDLFKN